jgi:hypothetical protein
VRCLDKAVKSFFCSDEYLDYAPTTKAVGSGDNAIPEPTALAVGALNKNKKGCSVGAAFFIKKFLWQF